MANLQGGAASMASPERYGIDSGVCLVHNRPTWLFCWTKPKVLTVTVSGDFNMVDAPDSPEKDETPISSIGEKTAQQAGQGRRGAIKKAAGVGLLMSSLVPGSALAAVSGRQFSNWMSGRLEGGSPGQTSTINVTPGRSIDYWRSGVVLNSDGTTTVLDSIKNANPGIEGVYARKFSDVYHGGRDETFAFVLHRGDSFSQAFAAAYCNALLGSDYPLTAFDLATLYSKLDAPGFNQNDIYSYLVSTW
jgi:hypothetical protein